MRNLLPHILILIAAKHGVNLAPDFLGRLGFRELSPEVITNIEKQTFPHKKYYDLVIISWFVLYITAIILVLFLSVFMFSNFQKSLLGQDAVYFSSNAFWIFGSINFFGTLILLFTFSTIFLIFFMPSGFKNYILSEQITVGYLFDFKISLKILLILVFLYYLFSSTFFYLAFRDYQAVFKDEVIANHFFDFATRKYSFDEVYNVTLSSEASGQDEVTISVVFLFVDGRRIDFFNKTAGLNDYHRVKNLFSELRLRKVTLDVTKPTSEVLSVVSKMCPKNQIEFYSLFDVDNPISQRPGCP